MSNLLNELAAILKEAEGELPDGWELVQAGEWVSEGKYEQKQIIYYVPDHDVHVALGHSRSGSYFTDYEYAPDMVYIVVPKQVTVTQYIATPGHVEID